ncbi:MAG: PAS domain S-box protein [Desulfobulbaceae bacterium]|nr:PAS domain S-box protein [Desulfobulbaceae bacterium]
MKRRSKKNVSWEENVNKIVGLGSKSIRKSYYPELKKKITSLDRQNVFYQSVLNSIPDGVVITDSSGVIQQVNPALAELFFYSTRDLTGKHISMLYFDDLNDEPDESLWTDKARNYRRKDGTQFIGEAHSSEIQDKTGLIIGNIEVIRDISERIETIRQKRRLEEQLLGSQKMEAIGSLAGGIAHDFNNILSGIIGYAELVEIFQLTDIDEIRHNLTRIDRNFLKCLDKYLHEIIFCHKNAENNF